MEDPKPAAQTSAAEAAAAAERALAPKPAPYLMTDERLGLFDLNANPHPEAPAPDASEAALAWWIAHILAGLRERLAAGEAVLPAQPVLRAAAMRGLCAEIRDAAAAFTALEAHFGPRPVGPQAAASGAYTISMDEVTSQISCTRLPQGPPPSEDQLRFIEEVAPVERLLTSLYPRPEQGAPRAAETQRARSGMFNRLAQAAIIALQDRPPDIHLARVAVRGIVDDAMREKGAAARASYLKRLGLRYFFTFAIAASIIGAFWLLTRHVTVPAALLVPERELVLLPVALGALMLGGWLTAALRLRPNSREVLDSIYASTFTPYLRAVFLLGFGVIAILLLHKQVVVFAFGAAPGDAAAAAFSTATVLTQLSSAILTGGFLGLSEAVLPQAVSDRAAGLANAIAPPPAPAVAVAAAPPRGGQAAGT